MLLVVRREPVLFAPLGDASDWREPRVFQCRVARGNAAPPQCQQLCQARQAPPMGRRLASFYRRHEQESMCAIFSFLVRKYCSFSGQASISMGTRSTISMP